MQMGFVEAVIQIDTRAIRVYNFHAGYLRVDERLAQIEHLARIYRQSPEQSVRGAEKPILMVMTG